MSIDRNKIREAYRAHINRYIRLREKVQRDERAAFERQTNAQNAYQSAARAVADVVDELAEAVADYRREFPEAPIAVD